MNLLKSVIGTWSLSGDFGPVDVGIVKEVLEFAYQRGFKEFDTAPAYGDGFMEFCLGNVFNGCKDVKINTKVGNLAFGGKSFKDGDMRRSIDESLKRLRGLPINVLFLHNPRAEIDNYEPVLEYLESLKRSGAIKLIGLSKAKGYPYESKVDCDRFDVLQDDLSLLYLESLKTLQKPCPMFMARSPLASGLLSGKIGPETTFHPTDHRSEWLKGERLRSLAKRVDVIKEMASGDVASFAKRFLFSLPEVDKVIFGVKSKAHIEELANDLNRPPLSTETINAFIRLYETDFNLVDEKQYCY